MMLKSPKKIASATSFHESTWCRGTGAGSTQSRWGGRSSGLTQPQAHLTQRRAFLSAGIACATTPSHKICLPSILGPTGTFHGLTGAVASRNTAVESMLKDLNEVAATAGPQPNAQAKGATVILKVDPVSSSCAVELKAFASAIDAAEKDIRILMSGVNMQERAADAGLSEEQTAAKDVPGLSTSASCTFHRDEEQQERHERLLQRILQYRFKRKISDPPAPLEPLTECMEKIVCASDKIDRNMRTSKLTWLVNRPSRVKRANKDQELRVQKAKQRREQQGQELVSKASLPRSRPHDVQ